MINDASLDLIKRFEGLKLETYRDSVGVLTIGYGTTAAAGVGIDPKPGMKITEAEAEEYLRRAVEKFAEDILPAIKVDVTDNEFGALVSLAYNIGPSAFKKSTVLRKLNAGDRQGAADAFLMWNKAGGKVLKGLQRRREAERALFLSKKAPRTSIAQSRTAQASAVSLMGAAGVVGTTASQIGALSETAQILLIGFGIVVAIAAVIIFRERLRKWAEGVR